MTALATKHTPKKPSAVDSAIGQQLKLRRQQLGLSQEKVAKSLGVSFQQIQKYESGTNRVSATRLNELSHLFGVDIQYFYAGVEQPQLVAAESSSDSSMVSPAQSAEILKLFFALQTQEKRRQALDFLRALVSKNG